MPLIGTTSKHVVMQMQAGGMISRTSSNGRTLVRYAAYTRRLHIYSKRIGLLNTETYTLLVGYELDKWVS